MNSDLMGASGLYVNLKEGGHLSALHNLRPRQGHLPVVGGAVDRAHARMGDRAYRYGDVQGIRDANS
jgi:hypothetical protein